MTQHTDPVCGTHVDSDGAVESSYRGKSYYFCSDWCRTKWEADPEKYAETPPASWTMDEKWSR